MFNTEYGARFLNCMNYTYSDEQKIEGMKNEI